MRRPAATSVALAFFLAIPSMAAASCVDTTARQDWGGADIVFVGIARESGDIGYSDFEVEAYLKGSGGELAHVRTGQTQPGVASSNDLVIRGGERWVVYAVERGGILRSDFCTGSHLLRGDQLPSAERLGAPPSAATGAPYVPERTDDGLDLVPVLLSGLGGLIVGVAIGAIVVPRLLVRRSGRRSQSRTR